MTPLSSYLEFLYDEYAAERTKYDDLLNKYDLFITGLTFTSFWISLNYAKSHEDFIFLTFSQLLGVIFLGGSFILGLTSFYYHLTNQLNEKNKAKNLFFQHGQPTLDFKKDNIEEEKSKELRKEKRRVFIIQQVLRLFLGILGFLIIFISKIIELFV